LQPMLRKLPFSGSLRIIVRGQRVDKRGAEIFPLGKKRVPTKGRSNTKKNGVERRLQRQDVEAPADKTVLENSFRGGGGLCVKVFRKKKRGGSDWVFAKITYPKLGITIKEGERGAT